MVRCLNCHYSLASLTEHRCPECGRKFDPNDPKTFETAASRRKHTHRWLLAIAAFALWAIWMALPTVDAIRNQRPIAILLVIMLAPVAAVLTVLIYQGRPRS